jgi:autotransporter-associated beta strand protein
MKKIRFYFSVFIFCGPLAVFAQTYQTFDASGGALNASTWSSGSASNACNNSGLTNSFTSGNIAYFCTSSGTGSGSVDITVGGIIVTENYTHSSGTANAFKTTGNSVVSIDVASGKTFDFEWRGISSNSGTGFIKNGEGTWDLTGPINGATPYDGGFTLNAGTVIAGGNSANAFSTGPMVINGGTLENTNSNNFTMSSLTIGGDFTLTGSGNPTFSMDVDLGSSIRTMTNSTTSGSRKFSGVISGTGGLTIAGSSSRAIILTGTNTYTGLTTVSGGILQLYKSGGGTLPSTNNCSIEGGTLEVVTNQTLNNLTVTSGTLQVNNGVTLTINGALSVNSGTTITLSGTGKIVYGSGSSLVYNASVSQTTTDVEWPLLNGPASVTVGANGVSLHAPRTISETLTLSGNLGLGTSNLTLSSGATISGATSASYVVTNGTGYLQRNSITSSTIFPVGNSSYNPISILNAGTVDDFTAQVSDEILTNGTSGSALTTNVVDRTWSVTEGSAGNSDVTLTAQWEASDELTGFTRGSCFLGHYTGGWASTTAASAGGSDPYTISRSGITSFSPFGIGSGTALPIKLFSFTAEREKTNALITWSTASELNSDYFSIERKNLFGEFKEIGTIKGSGNSNLIVPYSFTDRNPLSNVNNYYRLVQNDFDGNQEIFGPVRVSFEEDLEYVSLWPNPFINNLNLEFNEEFDFNQMVISDAQGRVVFEDHNVSGNLIIIPTDSWIVGIYTVILSGPQKQRIYKQIKI